MDTLPEDIDDAELKEELNSCNDVLVDSELVIPQIQIGSCVQPTEMCSQSQPCVRTCAGQH